MQETDQKLDALLMRYDLRMAQWLYQLMSQHRWYKIGGNCSVKRSNSGKVYWSYHGGMTWEWFEAHKEKEKVIFKSTTQGVRINFRNSYK